MTTLPREREHRRTLIAIATASVIWLMAAAPAGAAGLAGPDEGWPAWSQVVRVLTLRDYNTRVVVMGTMVLGAAAGIVGTFTLLRRRALVSDTISHATLPGIGAGFMLMTALGGDGKYLPVLLLAALVTAIAGIGCVLAIRHLTRLKEDAALGIVLSVFFGVGVAMLGIIQRMSRGNAAGLESFIYGKTASMLWADAMLIATVGCVATVVCLLLLKEFALVCFDQAYGAARGYPVLWLDVAMMGLVVAVTVVGLQAVGLILVVAMLIIPPAAARFWSDRLGALLVLAALIGATSGLIGAGLSAVLPRLPAGAVIVIVAATLFGISLLFGTRRGVVHEVLGRVSLRRRVARQHLLRALFEWHERREPSVPSRATPIAQLLAARSWSPKQLGRVLGRAGRGGLVVRQQDGTCALTPPGLREAARITRNHRLWEMYLITHADIAPSHVDRDADTVEHVLGHGMVEKLERLLDAEPWPPAVPSSPHMTEPVP